ncbi:MAG TPA: hypothetical protein VND91_11610 [Candidatus Saccharimonadia bacterium]|nr:hypothetical protein [Candidatus Saccharimonadia bacterium]
MEQLLTRVALALMLVLVPLSASGQVVADHVFVDGFESAVDCSMELACAVPPSGKSCISGQLTEAGSGAAMRAFFNAGLACGEGAIGGPCNLRLTAYDAIAFASDPGTAPLATTGAIVDGCGRFRFTTIDPPSFGFVTIVADDAAGGAENDLHVPGATLHALGANQRLERFGIVAVRRDAVARWTISAGSPFGASSFADVGTILLQFSANIPAAGATVLRNGSTIAGDDYYFSDSNPAERLRVDAVLTSTGVNGAALVAPAGSPTSYSGFGGEPAGCTWPSVVAASPAGVVTLVRITCAP